MSALDGNFEYDIFVSYSSRDKEWVLPFHDDLVNEINRRGKRDIKPFLDQRRLTPGFIWDDALEAAAIQSCVLVPVLTERFFKSSYCQKELLLFAAARGLYSGESHRSRIVPIRLLCSAPSDHLLAKIQSQTFGETRNDDITYEYRRGTSEYQQAISQAAHAIVQILERFAVGPPRGAVYLASVGPDLKQLRERLRNALSHQYDVLPEQSNQLLEITPDELQASFATDLGRAFVSVHPLGNMPSATPPGATTPLAELQLQAAVRGQKPRLIWQPSTTSMDDARRNQLCNNGFQWIENIESLQDHILRLWRKFTQSKVLVPRTDGERCIYFICPDRANKRKAEDLGIFKAFHSYGCGVYISPLDGDARTALKLHLEALAELDGCFIYYGDAEREWFDSIFLRVRKALYQHAVPRAVYLAPPPNEHKKDLTYLNFPILDPEGKTVEQTIAPFLEQFEEGA